MSTNPVHPGQLRLEEFLKPRGLSQYRLAKEIQVPLRRINEIVLGRRGVSADTAVRLADYFGTGPDFWLNLQGRYEMGRAGADLSATGGRAVSPSAPAGRRGAAGRPSARKRHPTGRLPPSPPAGGCRTAPSRRGGCRIPPSRRGRG